MMELDDRDRVGLAQETVEMLNPHFLFNALSTIRATQLVSPEKTGDLLCDFSDYLRARMRAATLYDSLIPFEDELSSVKAYLELEQQRMGTKLRSWLDIQCCDFLLPPLGILNLVEIMVRKSIFRSGKDGGTLRLSTWANGLTRCVELSCSGARLRSDEHEAVVSLAERLKTQCGTGVLVDRPSDDYLRVSLDFNVG